MDRRNRIINGYTRTEDKQEKTPQLRMKAWRRRQVEKGLVQVTVWVPAGCEEKIRAAAKRMRKN